VVYHMQRRMAFLLPMYISLAVSYEKEEFGCARRNPAPPPIISVMKVSLATRCVSTLLLRGTLPKCSWPTIKGTGEHLKLGQVIYLVQFCTSRDHQPPTIFCIPFAASVTYGSWRQVREHTLHGCQCSQQTIEKG